VSAPVDWDELPDVSPFDFDVRTMPARFREVGDRHAGLAGHSFDLTPLVELADRQERDLGLGELPYPPDYPKMPGEPMRVQPSRARRPAGGDD
jgi:hypothetical protein